MNGKHFDLSVPPLSDGPTAVFLVQRPFHTTIQVNYSKITKITFLRTLSQRRFLTSAILTLYSYR